MFFRRCILCFFFLRNILPILFAHTLAQLQFSGSAGLRRRRSSWNFPIFFSNKAPANRVRRSFYRRFHFHFDDHLAFGGYTRDTHWSSVHTRGRARAYVFMCTANDGRKRYPHRRRRASRTPCVPYPVCLVP